MLSDGGGGRGAALSSYAGMLCRDASTEMQSMCWGRLMAFSYGVAVEAAGGPRQGRRAAAQVDLQSVQYAQTARAMVPQGHMWLAALPGGQSYGAVHVSVRRGDVSPRDAGHEPAQVRATNCTKTQQVVVLAPSEEGARLVWGGNTPNVWP